MDNNSTTAAQPLDLDKLEALAKAATPGPWNATQEFANRWRIDAEPAQYHELASVYGNGDYSIIASNAALIAAANPATILALIAQARAAQPAQPRRIDKETAQAYMEETLWAFIECAGNYPSIKPDERIWAHIMAYAPTAAQAHHAAATTSEDAREMVVLGGKRMGRTFLAKLEQDAARYRLLVEKFEQTTLPCFLERHLTHSYVADGKASIDAAIDSAMRATQQEGGK